MARLLDPLRNAAAAFFRHDVALRRSEGRVQVVLQKRGERAPAAPSRDELAATKARDELALVRRQLAELLDAMPETRQTMRHLVFVERAIVKKGLRVLHALPLDVLQHALVQLEGLVTNWSPVGLANLRSKIAVAIIDRENQGPDAEADAYRTAAVLDPAQPAVAESSEAEEADEAQALAAAYAALGNLAPAGVEVQPALGATAARGDIRLRQPQV